MKRALLPFPCYHPPGWITVVQPTRNVSYTAPTNKQPTHLCLCNDNPLPPSSFLSFRWYSIMIHTHRVRCNQGQSKWTRSWLLGRWQQLKGSCHEGNMGVETLDTHTKESYNIKPSIDSSLQGNSIEITYLQYESDRRNSTVVRHINTWSHVSYIRGHTLTATGTVYFMTWTIA